LYRSEEDIRALCDASGPLRLSQRVHIWNQRTVAFPRKQDVECQLPEAHVRAFGPRANPAFATHDEKIIRSIQAYARMKDISPESFEFQSFTGFAATCSATLRVKAYRVRLIRAVTAPQGTRTSCAA
jgi:proline dehydrogenase